MLFQRILLLVFILGFCKPAISQNVNENEQMDDFLDQVDSLNYYLNMWEKFSPHGSIENYEKYEYAGIKVVELLEGVLTHSSIKNQNLDSLIVENGVSTSKSDDGSFYFFNVDQKTGGSYHPYHSFMFYSFKNGLYGFEHMGEAYHSIIDVVDENKQIYLVSSHLYGCNTCIDTEFFIVYPNLNELGMESFHSYSGRASHIWEYKAQSKEFSYEYESPYFDDSLYGDENEGGKRYKFSGKYRFVDGNFKEIEADEVVIEVREEKKETSE